jgi:Ca2+-binding EF-hand superfamily protein
MSVRCFVEEFPTPSTSAERNASRGKALCFLPNGFKIVGLVEGSVYLGEVVYDENWKRSYKFHLVEGPTIIKSSSPCSNPTSAFKEIEAVIKVTSTKKRHRKPDARSNGKLYMAVMYSATQRLLREKFRGCENQVPDDVRPLFTEWMENISSNKAFNHPVTTGEHSTGTSPHPKSQSSSLPSILASASKVVPVKREIERPIMQSIVPSSKHATFSFDIEHDLINGGDLHLNLDDLGVFMDKPIDHYSTPVGTPSSAAAIRKRGSGSIEETGYIPVGYNDSNSSRKRSSGSIDEPSPVLLTRKRASGSIDEEAPLLNEGGQKPISVPTSNPILADAGDLFAECFQLPDSVVFARMVPGGLRLGSSPRAMVARGSSGHGLQPQQSASVGKQDIANAGTASDLDDLIEPSDLYDMTSTQLYHILRNPQKHPLSINQIRAALAVLMQIPRDTISLKPIEEVVGMADKHGSGSVTIDNFVDSLELREKELQELFRKIDKDNTGDVTVEALRNAKSQGMLPGIDFDMEDLLERMSSFNFTFPNPMQANRRINFNEFRSMVLPIPPGNSIKTVIDLVRNGLQQETLEPEMLHL